MRHSGLPSELGSNNVLAWCAGGPGGHPSGTVASVSPRTDCETRPWRGGERAVHGERNAYRFLRGSTSMREEIRLGNEALAQNDIETAKQHFQHLLDQGGTHIQEPLAGDSDQARGSPPAATGEITHASSHASWQHTC